jgi:hypothetical protein
MKVSARVTLHHRLGSDGGSSARCRMTSAALDSRSSDNSVAQAKAQGVHTLVLPEGSTCAARQRGCAAAGEFIPFLMATPSCT